MSAPRYAVYLAPEETGALWRLGSAILGRDAASGAAVPFPAAAPCDAADWAELSAEPRRYGFHATLKAPFELVAGAREADLLAAADAFAAHRAGFVVDDLVVSLIGSFVALTPARENADLMRLAADCVVAFEPVRAPISAEDRARRLKSPLTERQIESVDRWGYPYVFEDFRFHMTLTGALPEARREPIRAALEALVGATARPLVVDAVAVYVQSDRRSPFRLLRRFPFGTAPILEDDTP